MPIYEFRCTRCEVLREELRKVGDFNSPTCCGRQMIRVLNTVSTVLKGSGWSNGEWSKLRKRSEDQGKEFFKKHPDKQNLVKETLERRQKGA